MSRVTLVLTDLPDGSVKFGYTTEPKVVLGSKMTNAEMVAFKLSEAIRTVESNIKFVEEAIQ